MKRVLSLLSRVMEEQRNWEHSRQIPRLLPLTDGREIKTDLDAGRNEHPNGGEESLFFTKILCVAAAEYFNNGLVCQPVYCPSPPRLPPRCLFLWRSECNCFEAAEPLHRSQVTLSLQLSALSVFVREREDAYGHVWIK